MQQFFDWRDIKPANILLEEGVERVTITDFGLARAVDDASMTCSGVIAGTPQYMSPEQARGEPIDARSDLFSLGGVLYAMCTGRSPFRAETTYGVLHRIANDKPTSVCEVNTDVPVWLGHVIDRLMAKRPEDRFESSTQVAELLEGCLAHVQQPAAMPLPEAVTALAPKKTRRPPFGKFTAAAAFAFALIFAGVFVVLELNKGTLTILSDVDDIRIRVTSSEKVVNELKVSKAGKSIRVAAGQYNIEIVGETDNLTIENGHVTLHRADTEVVRIFHNTGTLNKNEVGKKQSTNEWMAQLQGSWYVEQVYLENGILQRHTSPAIVRGNRMEVTPHGASPITFELVFGETGPPQQIDIRATLHDTEWKRLIEGWNKRNETPPQELIVPSFKGIIAMREDGFHVCTHDDSGVTRPLTFTDEAGRIDWYFIRFPKQEKLNVVVPSSSDLLANSIEQFNFLRTKDPLNDQPILTKDELIACASWNIERDHDLTVTQYAALSKIAKQHQWPEGWRIDGSYLDLPPDATPSRAYRISLVHSTTGEVFTIRERFLEPPSTYVKPVLNLSTEGTQHLTMAIKRFNARYNQADGHKQPPLTENEVVAAILHHQTNRDEADVSDTLFEKFQQIAKTGYLPEGASLEVIPTFGVEGGSTYTIWSVRIKMFLDEAGKEGWTHAFKVREQFVSVKHRDAGEIHWGQPAENGLQAGVRLSPPLLSYELGQKIDVEVFYRNILTKPISATVPNFCGYKATMHDANGNMMEILDLQEEIVGGARSETIGNEPISSHGRSLAFAPSSLAKDKREEYGIKTGASKLAFVEPGNSYRLQFTVSNLADSAAEPLKTGKVEISVVSPAPKPIDQKTSNASAARTLDDITSVYNEQGIEAAAIRDMATALDTPSMPSSTLNKEVDLQPEFPLIAWDFEYPLLGRRMAKLRVSKDLNLESVFPGRHTVKGKAPEAEVKELIELIAQSASVDDGLRYQNTVSRIAEFDQVDTSVRTERVAVNRDGRVRELQLNKSLHLEIVNRLWRLEGIAAIGGQDGLTDLMSIANRQLETQFPEITYKLTARNFLFGIKEDSGTRIVNIRIPVNESESTNTTKMNFTLTVPSIGEPQFEQVADTNSADVPPIETPPLPKTLDKPTQEMDSQKIYTAEELIANGMDLLKQQPVTVRFKVASVRRNGVIDPDGKETQHWFLSSEEYKGGPDPKAFEVQISIDAEKALERRGVKDIPAHFNGQELTIVGKVSTSGLRLPGRDTIWFYSITLERLDQLHFVNADSISSLQQKAISETAVALGSSEEEHVEAIVPLKSKVERQSAREAASKLVPTPFSIDLSKVPTIDHRNARSVVEAYVAAALAGEVAKAAALAKNSPADPKRIRELPEFLNVQRLKIQTVYINDPAKPTQALATSVAVTLDKEHKNPDGQRDGFLAFRLELADDKWFVIDIDLETESGAEKELNKFLKANPNSIGIPLQS